MGWLRPPEIKRRRKAEMALFKTGDYDANGDDVPVWRTNSKGKLIGIDRVMHGDDILRRMGRVGNNDTASETSGFVQAVMALLERIFRGK